MFTYICHCLSSWCSDQVSIMELTTSCSLSSPWVYDNIEQIILNGSAYNSSLWELSATMMSRKNGIEYNDDTKRWRPQRWHRSPMLWRPIMMTIPMMVTPLGIRPNDCFLDQWQVDYQHYPLSFLVDRMLRIHLTYWSYQRVLDNDLISLSWAQTDVFDRPIV